MEKLIEQYILAIETKDLAQFNTLTVLGCINHGEDKVQECLNEKLPLFLGASDMKTLLKYMVDCDEKTYVDLITSLLAEIIKVLQKEGYEFGKEFMYDYFLTIDQKSFNIFQEKLVEFIADREEIEEDLCDERGRPL